MVDLSTRHCRNGTEGRVTMDETPQGLRVDEAARSVGCSVKNIYKAIKLGRIIARAHTRGAKSEWRIDEESLWEWRRTLTRGRPRKEWQGRPVPVGAPGSWA